VAELYLRAEPDPETHKLALTTLLYLHPVSAEQVQFLSD